MGNERMKTAQRIMYRLKTHKRLADTYVADSCDSETASKRAYDRVSGKTVRRLEIINAELDQSPR